MTTRSNSWWMARAKGIYIYSLSPFRQRAFAGFSREMSNMIRQHWRGSLYFGSIAFGGWYLMKWANSHYHHSISKDPAFFDAEYSEIEQRSLGEKDALQTLEGKMSVAGPTTKS